MKLKSIKYSQFEGEINEWNLDILHLFTINLIVGKNATGKSKTLNLVNNLAKLLCGELKPIFLASANFDAQFNYNDKTYRYKIHIKKGAVIEEFFEIDEKKLLTRGESGAGKIFAEQLGENMEFQTPNSELAFTARRDSIQHPYFDPLYQWAKSVHFYPFGTPLGKNIFPMFSQKDDLSAEANTKNSEMVVSIYKKGEQSFGKEFKEIIMQDLENIGYDITDIGLAPPDFAKDKLVGLWVQEKELKSKTEQTNISQGMFRVLSLIVQLSYLKMTHEPSCILIDDVGEGLDFERSCALIELLISRATQSNIQLIMATNDRFTMNKVPLEMWTILHREGTRCRVFNIQNSKERFEEFRFTGLNNFDFFATDYLIEDDEA